MLETHYLQAIPNLAIDISALASMLPQRVANDIRRHSEHCHGILAIAGGSVEAERIISARARGSNPDVKAAWRNFIDTATDYAGMMWADSATRGKPAFMAAISSGQHGKSKPASSTSYTAAVSAALGSLESSIAGLGSRTSPSRPADT